MLQIVRKISDESEQSIRRMSIDSVYDHIKRSNSSLKRRPKKVLEDSIERVLDVLKEDEEDSEEGLDGNFDGIEDPVPVLKESNIMNKSITKMWAQPKLNSSRASTPPNRAFIGDGPTNAKLGSDSPTKADKLEKVDRLANGEPKLKRRKAQRSQETIDRSPPEGISLASLGGVDDVIEELTELVALPMMHPEIFTQTGIQPPRGVLLHGPPGCGKTMISNAFAATIGVSFIPLSAPSLVAGMSGESEKKIRDVFDEAKRIAPCLVFIDEIDVIMGKRESAQREMEKRIVAQMLTCMDDMALEKTDGKPVIIIAATNRPDSLDPALRRAGRFNKEINLGVPNESAREKILQALTQKLMLPSDFDYRRLAKMTPGFVGADLNDVVSVAGTMAMKRMMDMLKQRADEQQALGETAMDIDESSVEQQEPVSSKLRVLLNLVETANTPIESESFAITFTDFLAAVPRVQPSAKREGFATIPDTTWAHVGALHEVRDQLNMAIVEPIKFPEQFKSVGITAPAGVLLWGPPGCGKTLLAKAVANESKANFISIKGPELLNKYVGESERAVRQVFERARSSVPCILFFDELDALVPKREDSLSEASSKVVNTLLTELDGLSSRAGIYVVAATNRPDMIDPAMLRPGRLGTSVFIDLPDSSGRVEILRALYQKALPNVELPSMLDDVARDPRCEGYSGADLGNLHRAAAIAALKRDGTNPEVKIIREDWEKGLEEVKASVKDVTRYRRLKSRGL